MKKYYGYDIPASAARTPRQIADGSTVADLDKGGGSVINPLAALTNYGGGAVTPEPTAYMAPTAPTSTDPFMQGWTLPQTDMPYRRSLQRSAAEEAPQ
jgi:hypothetical protein